MKKVVRHAKTELRKIPCKTRVKTPYHLSPIPKFLIKEQVKWSIKTADHLSC